MKSNVPLFNGKKFRSKAHGGFCHTNKFQFGETKFDKFDCPCNTHKYGKSNCLIHKYYYITHIIVSKVLICSQVHQMIQFV